VSAATPTPTAPSAVRLPVPESVRREVERILAAECRRQLDAESEASS
jgi:hypothetical protein